MMKKKKKKKVPVDFEDFENVPVQPEPEKNQETEKNDNLEDIQEKKKEAGQCLTLFLPRRQAFAISNEKLRRPLMAISR